MLRSPLGDLRFAEGDYVFVPKGLLHRFLPDAGPAAALAVDRVPGRAARCRASGATRPASCAWTRPTPTATSARPSFAGPRDEGIRHLLVKRGGALPRLRPRPRAAGRGRLGRHGLPVRLPHPGVPAAGRAPIHLPPTWHGTFAARGRADLQLRAPPARLPPRRHPLPLPARLGRLRRVPLLLPGQLHLPARGGPGQHLAPPRRRHARPPPGRLRGQHRRHSAPTSWPSCWTPTRPLQATAAALGRRGSRLRAQLRGVTHTGTERRRRWRPSHGLR